MAERFTEFILRMAQDPKELEGFRKDADAVIKRAGLSPAEESILASANPALIREAIAADIGASAGEAAAEWVVVVVWVKSGAEQLKARSFSELANKIR